MRKTALVFLLLWTTAAVAAPTRPVARGTISNLGVSRLLAGSIRVDLPDRSHVVDAVYCGPYDEHSGRIVAVAAKNRLLTRSLSLVDCTASPSTSIRSWIALNKKAKGARLIELELKHDAWTLTLSLKGSQNPKRPGRIVPKVPATPLASVSTRGLQVLPSAPSLAIHVAFAADYIVWQAFESTDFIPEVIPASVADTSLIADIAFLNRLLELDVKASPKTLPGFAINVTRVRIDEQPGPGITFTLADATHVADATIALAAEADGDLSISEIVVTPAPSTCDALAVGERMVCRAAHQQFVNVAKNLQLSLSAKLHGTKFRPIPSGSPIPLSFGKATTVVRLITTSVSYTPGSFRVEGLLSIGAP